MTPRVALLNAVPFHTEVYAALLHAFVRAAADVQAFVHPAATAGMDKVIAGWCVRAAVPAAYSPSSTRDQAANNAASISALDDQCSACYHDKRVACLPSAQPPAAVTKSTP